MFGVFLQAVGSLFEEISCTIGKREVQEGHETIFMMGFLQLSAAAFMFTCMIALGFEKFIFSVDSLWTLLPRAVLETLQVHITLLAIRTADRSAFGFIKVGTVPLLLIIDFFLGYQIQPVQIAGMLLMIGAFIFIFARGVINKKGLGLVVFSTINAVLTITIFKYDISHFNSVGAEQLIIYSVLLTYLYLFIRIKTKERPLAYFRRPICLAQAFTDGIGTLIGSFAYVFAPPSVITAARRSACLLWSTLSGIAVFKEDNKKMKLFVAFVLIVVLVLLAL